MIMCSSKTTLST